MGERDVMTVEPRRKAMAHNRGRTGPERALGIALWRSGFRYLTDGSYQRRTGKTLPGRPDLVFGAERVVVFMDGCFWHGCEECGRVPPDMDDYWLRKIRANRERDRRVSRQLAEDGWRVIRVPEHALKGRGGLSTTVQSIAAILSVERSGNGR